MVDYQEEYSSISARNSFNKKDFWVVVEMMELGNDIESISTIRYLFEVSNPTIGFEQ
jgi:hypothetical protein